MAKNLPGLNYDGKLNIDDLAFQSDETEKAILERAAIVFGSRSVTTPRYGIMDLINPNNLLAEETTRPLLVYPNTINPLNVNITAGSAITLNGAIVQNPALVEDFALARILADDINIVYIENEIIDAPPVRKTRYNVNQYTRRIQNTSVLKVSLLTDFQNNIIFPPQRRANIVVLSVITVVYVNTYNTSVNNPPSNSVAGLELAIDYTNTVYTFNRPWYSPVDIEHRSQIGGGVVTTTNPHAMTFNDLSSGNLTLYDQLLDVGSIIARDDALKGVCGIQCYDTIDVGRVSTDGSGTITAKSRYGGIDAKYITLSKYPYKITAFYLSSSKGVPIAWDHIKGTRTVVLPNASFITSSTPATIWYNRVYSLEPPAQILSNSLTFNQPDTTKELIITGGMALTQMVNPTIDFDGSSIIPRNYTIYAKPDGSLLRSPQLLQTAFLLEDIDFIITPVSATMYGLAKVSIGLSGANSTSTMEIIIKLTGRDVDGNSISEDITFNGDTWEDTTPPASENPNQYVLSSQTFRTLDAIQVMSRIDDGPNSKIQLWAELETGTTLELNKLIKMADIVWDGKAVSSIIDQRKISKVIPAPTHRFYAAASIIGPGGTEPHLAFSEDFATPLLRDTTPGTQTAIAATTRIRILDITQISGDTIIFPNGKVVTAGYNPPNRTLGEFQISGLNSGSQTRDDLITTINYSGFNSGYYAIADTAMGTNTVIVNPTASSLSGARGNGVMSHVHASPLDYIEFVNASQNVIAGLIGGVDTFGECFMPKHMDYIDTVIPSPSTYDVSTYRLRYQSVALPIGNVLSVKVVLHGVEIPQNNIQLRARVAVGTDPVWLPWEVISSSTGASFTITKSSAITKIQIQIFGKASGFSIYEI